MKRREFLKYTAVLSAGLFVRVSVPADQALAAPARGRRLRRAGSHVLSLPGGTLDPTTIQKYVTPLVIPPAMPRSAKVVSKGTMYDYYEIAVRQFQQQILPAGMPVTTVWGYVAVGNPETLNYPAFTIEAKVNRPVRVKWINDLKDASGNYLPHLLPVDPTLHWANPPGGESGRDMRPTFTETPKRYTGPVPIVTHVHGAHAYQEGDGYPEAWFLPKANNIPAGYATTGTYYDLFKNSELKGVDGTRLGSLWGPDNAVFEYPNDQRASTLWYHDHTLGMTRLNVYAGPAGFYLLRGGKSDLPAGILPGPAPALGDRAGTKYYEIPIAIQDRAFNADGSLFYPDSRVFFDGFEGPYIPESDVSPIYNSEYFGNTMVVNGKTWPRLDVEAKRYRFRLLNGCQSRFLILKMVTDAVPLADPVGAAPALPFWQIGTEGGFLPAPVQQKQLLMGLAERADVIVDFSRMKPGTLITLVNIGPDEPFGGGAPGEDFEPSDPLTTGQVMQFRVVKGTGPDKSTPPAQLVLPRFTALGEATSTRQVSLNEADSEVLHDVGPTAAFLGTVAPGPEPTGIPQGWMDNVTENPAMGSTEVWEIYNFTADAHPIHIHLVQFQVVNREPMDGSPRGPEPWETGYKDSVIAYPGEITRVKANFDRKGRYVWHCHIVEHEDNEMMRPFTVG